MRIVADADIFSVRECFSEFGKLELIDGRKINSTHLQNADALLVRSITRIDEQMLAKSPVRFVGTATSGTDHVDTEYLQRRGIHFCHARGCNAKAVTEYCFAVLALLMQKLGRSTQGKLFSLIGVGQVGGLLARKLCELDIQCVAYDPLLEASKKTELETCGIEFIEYREALKADFITFHVPLSRQGNYPTYHQLSAEEMKDLPRDCVLLNTSRGAVIANTDLRQVLKKRDDLAVALDVWEGEPDLDPELLELVFLGTPHIAGYSMEAKLNATSHLLKLFCNFFHVEPPVKLSRAGDGGQQQLSFGDQPSDRDDMFCSRAILDALPLDDIDNKLRDKFARDPGSGAIAFDLLRRQLAERREFSAYQVTGKNLSAQQHRMLQVLGFNVSRH